MADAHRARVGLLRELEHETGRPVGILADLQGPKLRAGAFVAGPVDLVAGQSFRLDLDPAPGDDQRAGMPHPEIFVLAGMPFGGAATTNLMRIATV